MQYVLLLILIASPLAAYAGNIKDTDLDSE